MKRFVEALMIFTGIALAGAAGFAFAEGEDFIHCALLAAIGYAFATLPMRRSPL